MYRTERLGDVFLVTDYVANGSFASLKKNVSYLNEPGFAILVRYTDFSKGWNGNYRYVSQDSYNFLKKSSLNIGDLIISNVGEPGKTFLVPNLGMPMTLGPNSILVRPKSSDFSSEFFKYYIDSEIGQKSIKSIKNGATQNKFNKTDFRNLKISFPPIEKQKQIVKKLDATFAEIDKNIENLKNKKEQVESLVNRILEEELKNAEGENVKLGDVCQLQSGLWKGKKLPFQKAQVIRNTNFTVNGDLDYSNVALLDVETKQLENRRLKINDIILEKSGGGDKTPVGRVCMHTLEADTTYSFSNFTSRIRVVDDNKLNPIFLHRFLYFLYISGKTESMQRHSTGIRNLQLKEYKEINVPLPPLEEQKQIVKKLDAVNLEKDRSISTLNSQIDNYIALKSSILSNSLKSPSL